MVRALVVDDDDLFREFMVQLMYDNGYEILQARGGAEALATLLALDAKRADTPHLMVVDFNMRDMNGFELIRSVRMMESFRALPIVMVTGTTKDISGALTIEGVKYVPKWSPTRDLLKNLQDAIPKGMTLLPREAKGDAPAETPAPTNMKLEFVATTSKIPEMPASSMPDEETASDDELQRLMGLSRTIANELEQQTGQYLEVNLGEESSQIVNLVNGILTAAIQQNASDIHLDPQTKALRVRFRIDGILHSKAKLPIKLCDNIVSRLKIMCNLNVTERRMPQDGRFSLRMDGSQQVECRLSTLPANMGEKIVIRLLKHQKIRTRLKDVFLRADDLEHVETALKAPNGMILVTGPTGSGKTTTLYTMLDVLNVPTRNIITIEDPVENEVPGVTQVPVRPQIGYTFEKVIRACMRQDPNIIMVGEIRDAETAEIAMKAAMTGHLVLSTLHANTAPLAIYRLVTMGIKPFLIVSSLQLVIAQRLLRLLCPHCKARGKPDPEVLAQLSKAEQAKLSQAYLPQGCEKCQGIGYKGRRAVTEVLPFKSHEIRQLAYECANPDLIKAQAVAEGMVTISEAALAMVAAGDTSLLEALSLYGD